MSQSTAKEVMAELKRHADPKNVAGMQRFGISGKKMLGVSVTWLRAYAKPLKKNHALALALWKTGFHEARILASMLAEPKRATPELMDAWMRDFDSWDVCDQTCGNFFDKTPFAWKKAKDWAKREKEFERRAGFALMATLAWHSTPRHGDAQLDKKFEAFFPFIIRYSTDERNFVKKAVNWALRQIGKRNEHLRRKAIRTAKQILEKYPTSKAARFVAKDALRELNHEKTRQQVKKTRGIQEMNV